MSSFPEQHLGTPPLADAAVASRRAVPFSYRSVGALMIALDVITIELSSILAGTTYHLLTLGNVGDTEVYAVVGLVASYIFVSVLHLGGFYRSSRIVGGRINYRHPTLVWLLVFLFLFGIAFVLQIGDAFSRGAVLSFMGVGLVGVLGSRAAMGVVVRRAIADGALKGMRIVYIGQAGSLSGIDHLNDLRRFGYRVIHSPSLPNDAEGRSDEESAGAIVADVLAFARDNRVDEIVLGLGWSNIQLIDRISVGLRRLPLPVRLLPDGTLRHLVELPTTDFGASIALELQRGPLDLYQRALKRSFDLLVSLVGLISALPLLLIVAAIVKLDSSGPIFFRQVRTGYSGRTFRIFKFRTMRVMEDGAVVRQARKDDDRITRSGRWLRRTSIDELPQLLNVVLGDMSLVGPRPHALAHDVEYDKLIGNYGHRYQVKPGITGWAQVNGFRGETATVDLMTSRVEYDLWYISNWTLILDIRTLFKTVLSQIKASNAY